VFATVVPQQISLMMGKPQKPDFFDSFTPAKITKPNHTHDDVEPEE
jgi:hypothetical protein